MSRKRRPFTDKFKAEVALEAVKGVKTLAELATEHQLPPAAKKNRKNRDGHEFRFFLVCSYIPIFLKMASGMWRMISMIQRHIQRT